MCFCYFSGFLYITCVFVFLRFFSKYEGKTVKLSFFSVKSTFLASLGLVEGEKVAFLSQLEVLSENRYLKFFFSEINFSSVLGPSKSRRHLAFFSSIVVGGPSAFLKLDINCGFQPYFLFVLKFSTFSQN